jgi:hypothetical protein
MSDAYEEVETTIPRVEVTVVVSCAPTAMGTSASARIAADLFIYHSRKRLSKIVVDPIEGIDRYVRGREGNPYS